MHSGLGAQPAVGVFADDMHSRALDSRHFARGCFYDFGFELMCLSPTQVHAQYHFGPILSFCSARTGLDIDKGALEIHFAREHAPKFQSRKFRFEIDEVANHLINSTAVVLFDCHFQQFTRILETRRQVLQGNDDLFEGRALLPERLRSIRFVPDIGLLEFALNLGQAFRLAVIVKDTPSTR